MSNVRKSAEFEREWTDGHREAASWPDLLSDHLLIDLLDGKLAPEIGPNTRTLVEESLASRKQWHLKRKEVVDVKP